MSHTLYELRRTQRTARAARERLALTIGEVRARLAPEALAQEAWTEVKAQARAAAADIATTARRRPVATLALCMALLAFVAREPLARALKRLFFERDETPPQDQGLSGDKEAGT